MSAFKRLLRGTKCTCGLRPWTKCTCPRDEHYTIMLRDPKTKKPVYIAMPGATMRECQEREKIEMRERFGERREEFLEMIQQFRQKSPWATFRELRETYLGGDKILKTSTQTRRNINDLYRVVAYAQNLWTEHTGGIQGVKIGLQIPNREKIDRLHVDILNFELVKRYFRAACGGELDWHSEREGNQSVNSTLGHAMDVFSERSLQLVLDKLALPDLTSFRKHPMLQEPDLDPTPLTAEQFKRMLEARATASPSMRAINIIATQTGIRPSSIMHLHTDWLQRRNDGWGIDIKKGKTKYTLPVTDEVANIIQTAQGYLLTGNETQREKAVAKHTKWIKAVLGIEGKGQGTYLLRKTAACIVKTLYGQDIVRDYIGHDDQKSLQHYAQVNIHISPEMRHELRAATRLVVGNVVQMPTAVAVAA